MTDQGTIDKPIEMCLTTMAGAFHNQPVNPKFKKVPFKDRFGMMIDIRNNLSVTLTSTIKKQISWISSILPDAS